MNEHAWNSVRTAAVWRRKAEAARASANEHPEDKAAMENIAEMYEQMAERVAELDSRRLFFELERLSV
jgi:EAL domain-containing protein (putative c-di-GMP-specific phosphodiesterase class I)